MKENQIIFYCGFNCAKHLKDKKSGPHFTLKEEWVAERFRIWRDYCWHSIVNQTYKDWIFCLRCDLRSKPLIKKYFRAIKNEKLFVVYEDSTQEERLIERFYNGSKNITNVRIDSDDMYHPDALQNLVDAIKRTGEKWYLFKKGYGCVYSQMCQSGSMKVYNPPLSGPFYARMLPRDEWKKDGIKIKIQHHHVCKKDPVKLKDGMVMVGIHPGNTSTRFGMKRTFRSKLTEEEMKVVLREFKLI